MLLHALTVHFAYLDPSTGSVVIQAIIGAIAGASLFGRRVIGNGVRKIKSLFGGKSNTQETTNTEIKAKATDRS